MINSSNARIVTLTIADDSRESANVYYSSNILVCAGSGLTFSEDIFDDLYAGVFEDFDQATKSIIALGYDVIDLPSVILGTNTQ